MYCTNFVILKLIEDNNITISITEVLTEEQRKEELEKLYAAIGYSEGEVITAFPKEVHQNMRLVINA